MDGFSDENGVTDSLDSSDDEDEDSFESLCHLLWR